MKKEHVTFVFEADPDDACCVSPRRIFLFLYTLIELHLFGQNK